MQTPLNNKTALIIGASSGIGAAIAQKFAAAGATVVVAARRIELGQQVADDLLEQGQRAAFFQADVNDSKSIEALLAFCINEYGSLDIAVNNAGIEGTPFTATADYDESVFTQVIDTNLTGMWRCMKYEIPLLLQSKGSLINMASIAGLGANEMMGCAYTASKHGIVGMTKTAAREYAKQGLRINAICPGVIETEISDRSFLQDENIHRRVLKMHPLGRFGRAEEVADAALYLASDQSSFMTGHAMVLDGGVSC